MLQHPIYPLNCPNNKGQLLLTPCPGTVNESLGASLQALKRKGAAAIITLMTTADLAEHKVEALGHTCETLGLEWFHLPIEDESVPSANTEQCWLNARKRIHQYLNENKAVVVHCKGGSGRTGILAATILLERGVDVNSAIDQIKALRPKAFSHSVQVDYILARGTSAKN